MRHLLRLEHWILRKFKFDRMSNNVFWLGSILAAFYCRADPLVTTFAPTAEY